MSKVEPRTVAFVKTSGEVGFVLAIGTPVEGSPPLVSLRVPVVGQNGIHHEVREFLLDELETFEERLLRERGEKELYVKFFQEPALSKSKQDRALN